MPLFHSSLDDRPHNIYLGIGIWTEDDHDTSWDEDEHSIYYTTCTYVHAKLLHDSISCFHEIFHAVSNDLYFFLLLFGDRYDEPSYVLATDR